MISFKRHAWPGVLALVCLLTGILNFTPIPGMNGQALADTGPDLIIDSISWSPEVPAIQDKITFTVTVSNQGDSAAPPSYMDYYIDDCFIDTVSFDSISAGSTAANQFTWQALAGDHTIKAIVDSTDAVAEINEDNNVKNYVFPVIAADLIIESITWSPQTVSMGETVTFTVQVKNQGNKTSSYCSIEFFIDDASRGQKDCRQLEPGECKTFTYTWVTQPSQHIVKATIDIINQCIESDETNNDLTISYNTAAPDLIVQSISWSPTEHSDTENITIYITVKNQGLGTAPASSLDFYIDGIGYSQIYFDTLYSGYTDTKTFTWLAGPAEHILSAAIDANNLIYESDESNNTYSVTLPSANPPDLLIDSITWTPTPPMVNSLMTYTITVRNAGNRIVQECDLDFYAAYSHKINKSLGPVLPGSTASVQIQYLTSEEPLQVRAIVDPDNRIAESDETNNELTVSITLTEPTKVDFFVASLICTPQNPAIGDEVTITTNLKNNSTVKTGASHLAYYIDGQIAEIIPIGNINAKHTITNTITWIATPGNHTIKVVADYNDYYNEVNEANNTREISVSILSPDLAIQSITWSPEIPVKGDNLSITFTIINQGTYQSNGCYADYYVDGEWVGDHYIEDIAPGGTVTRTFPWTLTDDFQSFRIIVDKDNDISESNESNNTKTATIPAPDLLIESVTCSHAEFIENSTVTLVITIANVGSTTAESSYLDCYINDILQANLPVSSIPAGSSTEVFFEWTMLPGDNTFKGRIDSADNIVEINETNNEQSAILVILTQTDIEILPGTPAGGTTENTTSNGTQEGTLGIFDTNDSPPAQDNEAAPAANDLDELTELFNEETPLWQNIMSNQWIIIGVAVLGVAVISVLLVLRKRSRRASVM
jgi:subtilase family serine protease